MIPLPETCAPSSVRFSKRHSDGDGVGRAMYHVTGCQNDARAGGDGSNNCCLRVCTIVYGDGLTDAKACHAGNRDNCCTRFGGSTHCGASCCTNNRDNSGLAVCTCIDNNLLTNAKACHTGDFNIV